MKKEDIQLLIDFIDEKETSVINKDLDMNNLIRLCKNHSLLPILYKACQKYKVSLTEKQEVYLKKNYQVCLMREATQELEKQEILKTLSENNIKCMPLKGSILKFIYPSPELRTMCDLDILYDKSNHKKVKSILKMMGYKCDKVSGKDDEFSKPPFMNVEMHKIMVDSGFEVIADYYDNIWEVVKPTSDNSMIYKMSNEDFYVHMIAHIARHYSVEGIGIRFVFDEWLYLKKYKNILNFNYIENELKKISLLKFEKNFKNMTIKWFTNQEMNQLEIDMTDYIFNSGTHGSLLNEQSINLAVGEGTKNFSKRKFKYFFKKIFPPFSYMKERNEILKKLPILLPFFYVQRLIIALFKKREMAINTITGIDKFNEEYSKKVVDLHEKSGI